MQKGVVMERGTHKELIDMNGFYKQLVQRQLVAEALEKKDKDENEEEEENAEGAEGAEDKKEN